MSILDESPDHVVDKSASLGSSSPQPPPTIPTAWSELVSAAVKVTEIPTSTKIRQCEICLEDLPFANFPSRRISTGCNHEPSCCLPCLRRSIKTDHENKIWDAISCPECSSRLSYQDLQAFADAETFMQ